MWEYAEVPEGLAGHPLGVSGLTLFLPLLLGSPQQKFLSIACHILPATPVFFWVRPEGVTVDIFSGCPTRVELPTSGTSGVQWVPPGTLPLTSWVLQMSQVPLVSWVTVA